MLERHKFLFYKKEEQGYPGNPLRDMMLFLKKSNFYVPHNFTYSPKHPNLIGSLTLKQNILLESIPISLCTQREFQLEEYLKKTQNEALIKLYQSINLVDLFTNKADLRLQKITSLVRSFIKDSPVIFFEKPNEHLDDIASEHFKKALMFHRVQKPDQLIIIIDNENSNWLSLTPHILSHNKPGLFTISENQKIEQIHKFMPPTNVETIPLIKIKESA